LFKIAYHFSITLQKKGMQKRIIDDGEKSIHLEDGQIYRSAFTKSSTECVEVEDANCLRLSIQAMRVDGDRKY
jgi:hypothetical protein